MDGDKKTEIAELIKTYRTHLQSAFDVQQSLYKAKELLIQKLFSQLKVLAVSKGYIFEEDDDFFEIYNGFSFFVPHWKNVAIGFEFQKKNTNNMIFGLYHRNTPLDLRGDLDLYIQEQLKGASTPTWPFFKKFDYQDWEYDELPWLAIENGEMLRLLGQKLDMIRESTKGLVL
ncbi:hypothetical protein [Pedobacter sp. R-06]|uniref:hypothetical protein n=1 Tax=Pedobacter sp. R-06 TaxID=3404051 RepID=UPI003CF2EDC6